MNGLSRGFIALLAFLYIAVAAAIAAIAAAPGGNPQRPAGSFTVTEHAAYLEIIGQ